MEFECHPDIKKDLKIIEKKCKHVKELFPTSDPTTLEEDVQYRPMLWAAYNFYCNTIKTGREEKKCTRWDYQPYACHNIYIWKVRYRIDNRGASHGLRIMMANMMGRDRNVFIGIFRKYDVLKESDFQRDIHDRLHRYFGRPS